MRRTIHTGKSLAGFGPALSSLFAVLKMRSIFCLSVASAVWFLSPMAALAAEPLNLTLDNAGTVTNIGDFEGIGAYAFLTKTLVPNSGNFPVCSGGLSGTGSQFSDQVVGLNVFDDGGLGTGDCIAAGDYYIMFTDSSPFNTVLAYAVVSWDGQEVTTSPVLPEWLESSLYYGTFDTRLITASSSGSRLTPNIGLQYYLDPSEFTFQNTPDSVSINVWKDAAQDTFIGTDTPIILSYVSGTSTRNFTFSKSLDANSTYRVNITFYNRLTGSVVLPRTSITMTIVTDGSNVVSYTVNKVADGRTFPEAEYEDCGLTSLSGCLNNSMRFLFIPDAATISQFEATYNSLWEKAPFIYISQLPEIIDSLFTQTGGTFSIGIDTGLGEFTFFNAAQVAAVPNANTIKNLGAAFLWISLAFMFYRKTLAIHDKTTV